MSGLKPGSARRLGIVLGVLFGIVVIFSLILAWPLITGKTVVLATMPVDPMDVFRGQYLSIRYEASTLNTSMLSANQGDTVYVTITPDKYGIWRLAAASTQRPSQGIFLKGTVTNRWGNGYQIDYGIEQYFFERNAHINTRNMTVVAKVDSSGTARIVELRNGQQSAIQYYPNASIYS